MTRMSSQIKRAQNKACLTCKRRKVRCDWSNDRAGPCSACRKFGSECIPNPTRSRQSLVPQQIATRPISVESVVEPPHSSQIGSELSPSTGSASAHEFSRLQLRSGADSLASFVEHGIATNDWKVFAGSEPERIVYVGTDISNFSQLVRSEQSDRYTNHYPFPQIHDLLPWKPTSEQIAAFGLSERTHSELSSFPTKSVRDDLVDAFFDLVNPGYPVINETEFRKQYNDPNNPPPLLLFQAVLLVGAHVSDHPVIVASRGMVTSTLFRRAKILFGLRHENDRLFLVQAALLLAWHTENSDSVSGNHFYWIGIACRIAFGLGMHRDLSEDADCLMPVQDRHIYRRVWWTLLQAEVFSALEYGRPSMIRQEDFDQKLLLDTDFIENEGGEVSRSRKDFLRANIQLALLALEVLQSRAPRVKRDHATRAIETFSQRIASVGLNMAPVHDFWACQLRLNYNLTLLLFYGRSPNPSETGSPAEEVALICGEAASDILTTFEAMASQQTIRQCQFSSISALMAATIQFSQNCKTAVKKGAYVRALGVHGQLQRLLDPAKKLSEYWPNAEPIARLCQYFCDKYGCLIRQAMEVPHTEAAEHVYQGFERNWQDIFANFDAQQFGHYLQEQPSDWMSSSVFLNG